jgi:hypothetical protein
MRTVPQRAALNALGLGSGQQLEALFIVMKLCVGCCRSIQAPAAGLCSGLQHNSAAVAAAYLQQQLLTYNPTTASTAPLPFAAIKHSASAFTAPLGEHIYLWWYVAN